VRSARLSSGSENKVACKDQGLTLTAYPSKLSTDLLEARLEGHPLPRPQQILKLEHPGSEQHQDTVFCEVSWVSLPKNAATENACQVGLKVLHGSPALSPYTAVILDSAQVAKAAHRLLSPIQNPILIGAKGSSELPVDFFRLGALTVVEGGNELSIRISALMQILRGIQPYQRILLIDPIGIVMPSDASAHIRAGRDGGLALQQVGGKRFLEVFAETLPEFLREAGLRTVASILPQSSRGSKNEFIGFQSLLALEALTEAPLRNLILQTLYTLMDAKVFAEKPEEVLSFKKGLPSPITILDISILPDPWKGFFYAEICQRALHEVEGELVLAMLHPEIYLPDWPKWIQQASEEELNYLVVPSPFRVPSASPNSHPHDWKASANNVFTISTDGQSFTLKGDLSLDLPIRYALKTDALMSSQTSSQASIAAWQTPFDADNEVAPGEVLPEYPSELRQALAPKEQTNLEDDADDDSVLEYHTYSDDYEEKDYSDADDDLDEDEEANSEDEVSDDDDADDFADDSEEESESEESDDDTELDESEEDDDTDEDDLESSEETESASSEEADDEEEAEAETYYSSYLGGQESIDTPPAAEPKAEANPPLFANESIQSNQPQLSSSDSDPESDLSDDFNFSTTLLPDDPAFSDQSSKHYQQNEQAPSNPDPMGALQNNREQAPTDKEKTSSQGSSALGQVQEPQRHSVSSSHENDDDFGDEESGDFNFNFDATLYEPSWLTPASNWQPSPSPRASQKARYAEEEEPYSAPSRQDIEAYKPSPAVDDQSASDDDEERTYHNDSYSDYEENEGEYAEESASSESEPSPDEQIPVVTRNTAAPKVPAGYFVGERIRHPQYGLGTITKILPMADQVILNITFDQVGKRLLDPSLCELTREGGE